MKHRPIPLWFWNNTEVTKNGIVAQLKQIKEAGYGGVSILPFGKDFKPKYLTEAYFDVYKTSIEEAAQQILLQKKKESISWRVAVSSCVSLFSINPVFWGCHFDDSTIGRCK
ncbi:hypothetical protein ACFSQ3_09975 [Sphingobacterium corticis]|uniref:Glycosyl hydrolase family 13 catalytic domain-containing protein n=1 Tax=Sphingobacterium corticis TaxID=1812823 RepID=A0ABW5NJG9_9SPHI